MSTSGTSATQSPLCREERGEKNPQEFWAQMYKITEDLFMHLSLHFPLTSKDWYSYFNVGGLTSKLFSEKRLYTATLLYLNPYELS